MTTWENARRHDSEELLARIRSFHLLTRDQVMALPCVTAGNECELTGESSEMLRSFLAAFQVKSVTLGGMHPDPVLHSPNLGTTDYVYVTTDTKIRSLTVEPLQRPTENQKIKKQQFSGDGFNLQVFSSTETPRYVLCQLTRTGETRRPESPTHSKFIHKGPVTPRGTSPPRPRMNDRDASITAGGPISPAHTTSRNPNAPYSGVPGGYSMGSARYHTDRAVVEPGLLHINASFDANVRELTTARDRAREQWGPPSKASHGPTWSRHDESGSYRETRRVKPAFVTSPPPAGSSRGGSVCDFAPPFSSGASQATASLSFPSRSISSSPRLPLHPSGKPHCEHHMQCPRTEDRVHLDNCIHPCPRFYEAGVCHLESDPMHTDYFSHELRSRSISLSTASHHARQSPPIPHSSPTLLQPAGCTDRRQSPPRRRSRPPGDDEPRPLPTAPSPTTRWPRSGLGAGGGYLGGYSGGDFAQRPGCPRSRAEGKEVEESFVECYEEEVVSPRLTPGAIYGARGLLASPRAAPPPAEECFDRHADTASIPLVQSGSPLWSSDGEKNRSPHISPERIRPQHDHPRAYTEGLEVEEFADARSTARTFPLEPVQHRGTAGGGREEEQDCWGDDDDEPVVREPDWFTHRGPTHRLFENLQPLRPRPVYGPGSEDSDPITPMKPPGTVSAPKRIRTAPMGSRDKFRPPSKKPGIPAPSKRPAGSTSTVAAAHAGAAPPVRTSFMKSTSASFQKQRPAAPPPAPAARPRKQSDASAEKPRAARPQQRGREAAVDENAAATKIQASFRGKKARQSVSPLRQQLREEAEAATKIQAVFRGKQARTSVSPIRQRKKAEEDKAATKIQAVFRGKQARTSVSPIRQRKKAEEDQAATKIQATFRGKQARHTAEKAKEEKEQAQAATRIQATFRGRRTRQSLSPERNRESAAPPKMLSRTASTVSTATTIPTPVSDSSSS
ncbi:hypothetical protein DIPPA_01562 [Diplonema papillatum]|nr:hypothetical protein DIPPA_01562 [Diplonema papillatum]